MGTHFSLASTRLDTGGMTPTHVEPHAQGKFSGTLAQPLAACQEESGEGETYLFPLTTRRQKEEVQADVKHRRHFHQLESSQCKMMFFVCSFFPSCILGGATAITSVVEEFPGKNTL